MPRGFLFFKKELSTFSREDNVEVHPSTTGLTFRSFPGPEIKNITLCEISGLSFEARDTSKIRD